MESTPDLTHSITMINGNDLDLTQLMAVVNGQAIVSIDHAQISKINEAYRIIQEAFKGTKLIYGVNANFGAMAVHCIDDVELLQANLIAGLKCGIGPNLSIEYMRAIMLARANSLVKGCSGIRLELIARIVSFLNKGITPLVPRYGSIGASGDLIPLSYLAGSIVGHSEAYKVLYQGKELSCLAALEIIDCKPLKLHAKEGLALVNGTAVMTGIAAHCTHDLQALLKLTLCLHAFFIESLQGSIESFEPFIHRQKPHPGQWDVAAIMFRLLTRDKASLEENNLFQDRYSIRCIPQYLGPIFENIAFYATQLEVELNSANDNPLVEVESKRIYSCGNFMGEHVGIAMDHMRHYIGLVAKHLDTQLALLVTPEFSNGLSPSLVGNPDEQIKFGLKGLQICANSLLPLLLHAGHPITHLFPTHAEQYNQNINSQGTNAALLTSDAITLFKRYLAVALIFSIQAIELRAFNVAGTYDVSTTLSPSLEKLYQMIYTVLGKEPRDNLPFLRRNTDFSLDHCVEKLFQDLSNTHTSKLLAVSSGL